MAHSDDESILELDTNPNDFDFFESADFQKQKSNKNEDKKKILFENKRNSENEDFYGPSLPPKSSAKDSGENSDDNFLGPALPPHLIQKSKKIIGPELPKHLAAVCEDNSLSSNILGPQLPPHLIAQSNEMEDDSDEFIGPLPGMVSKNAEEDNLLYAQAQMIERAERMKSRLTGKEPENTKRESWMLELPPDRANEFGLGARQFRRKEKDPLGDRTVWTTTPQERLEQANAPSTSNVKEEEMQMNFIKERDEAMQKLADSHKSKKKKKSLLEKHQKKLKKKMKKEASKPIERRPFDRNVDLQANRFDDAMKKSIIKKAQLLDDRFSKGKSKFL